MPTRKIFLEKYGAEEFKDEMKTNLDLRHNYQKCQENLLSYKGKNLLNFVNFFLENQGFLGNPGQWKPVKIPSGLS